MKCDNCGEEITVDYRERDAFGPLKGTYCSGPCHEKKRNENTEHILDEFENVLGNMADLVDKAKGTTHCREKLERVKQRRRERG